MSSRVVRVLLTRPINFDHWTTNIGLPLVDQRKKVVRNELR